MVNELQGIELLAASVQRDCEKGCNCFNPDGCNVPNQQKDGKSCFHAYCDTYKWVIDRAQHYAEKTGSQWEEIVASWESDRNYWYVNYYQEGNQPKLDGNVRVFDTMADLRDSIGTPMRFRCPACKGSSTSPYECDSGKMLGKNKVCDWKSWGLLRCLGEGATVYVKERLKVETIFMPIAWEGIESPNP